MKKGLGLKGNKLWKYIAISMGRAAMVTLLAFLLSFLIIEPMSLSTLSIFSAPEKNDFSVTDLYAQVADRRPVRTLDPDIVLVDIGHADRNEIASILQRVNFWNPRVVGIDVMFASPGDSDSLLLKALGETGCLVIPLELANAGKDAFKVKCAPFFYNDKAIKATYAASNLPSEFEGATIREFVTTFPLSAGGEVESFPMALAGAYNPECIKALRSRKNHLEPIDYPSREFLTLTPDDIDLNGDQLTGRLVILGALSDADDMHSTPINSYMSGLSIQGAATATILSGRFYDPASRLPAWLPACLLCFLILLVREFTHVRLRGIITRFLQLIIIYLAVRIGYGLYVDHQRVFNFSYTMLMAGFGLFASDIWIGFEYIAELTINFFRRLQKRRATDQQ